MEKFLVIIKFYDQKEQKQKNDSKATEMRFVRKADFSLLERGSPNHPW